MLDDDLFLYPFTVDLLDCGERVPSFRAVDRTGQVWVLVDRSIVEVLASSSVSAGIEHRVIVLTGRNALKLRTFLEGDFFGAWEDRHIGRVL